MATMLFYLAMGFLGVLVAGLVNFLSSRIDMSGEQNSGRVEQILYWIWRVAFGISPILATLVSPYLGNKAALGKIMMLIAVLWFVLGSLPILVAVSLGRTHYQVLKESVSRQSKATWRALVSIWALAIVVSIGYSYLHDE